MSKKDFLQRKYEEINKLKSMLTNYPDEYKQNIVDAMNKVSDEINAYLEKSKNSFEKIKRASMLQITLEELKKYDGKDGRLAYVAVDGTIYDVTPIKVWLNGKHYGLVAGQDLTEFFNSCHQSEKNILKKLKIVGTLKA